MKTENWKDITGYPGYRVSDLGRVLSNRKSAPLIMATNTRAMGFRTVSITGPDKCADRITIHSLVLRTFDPIGSGRIVFVDGDKENCRLDNLRWAS